MLTEVESNKFSLESVFNRRLRSFCNCCESAVDFLWHPATSLGLLGGGRQVKLPLEKLQQLPTQTFLINSKSLIDLIFSHNFSLLILSSYKFLQQI